MRGKLAVLLTSVVAAFTLVSVPVGGATAVASDYPMSVITSPSAGVEVSAGSPLTVRGIAVNGEAGGIIGVEISLDGGATWHTWYDAEPPGSESWSYTFTPTQPGVLTIVSRAATANAVESPYRSVTVKVVASEPGQCPCTMHWPTTGLGVVEDPDTNPVELGLRFQTDRDGYVTGLLFARYWYNTGPHIGHLWSAGGDLLAEQTLTSTGDFFPYIQFAEPVPIQAGQTYVVSYYTPSGHYASTENYFDSPIVAPPFTTVVDEKGGSGVYHYGAGGGFPDQTWHASNYWVEPVFTTATAWAHRHPT